MDLRIEVRVNGVPVIWDTTAIPDKVSEHDIAAAREATGLNIAGSELQRADVDARRALAALRETMRNMVNTQLEPVRALIQAAGTTPLGMISIAINAAHPRSAAVRDQTTIDTIEGVLIEIDKEAKKRSK